MSGRDSFLVQKSKFKLRLSYLRNCETEPSAGGGQAGPDVDDGQAEPGVGDGQVGLGAELVAGEGQAELAASGGPVGPDIAVAATALTTAAPRYLG